MTTFKQEDDKVALSMDARNEQKANPMESLVFVQGTHYFVQHDKNKQRVRRIFKRTEKRFGNILCYVFTAKVTGKVSVEIEGDNWHWRGVKHAPNEISIPFYNMKSYGQG